MKKSMEKTVTLQYRDLMNRYRMTQLTGQELYDQYGVKRDEVLFSEEAQFDDGHVMELSMVAGEDNEYYEEESSEENNDNNDEYNVSSNDSINISDEPSGMIEEIPKYKAGGVNQLKLDDGADVKINDNNDIIAPQTQEELE